MREDYLWDRSGEPDPEIERLELTLQKLRHQPRPLRLPVARVSRQPFRNLTAIAAALVLMVLAGGTWLALRRSNDTTAHRLTLARQSSGTLAGLHNSADSFTLKTEEATVKRDANALPTQTAREANRPRRMIEERYTLLTLAGRAAPKRRADEEQVIKEGEIAKERLMLALHFASSKLNLVQRKIQVNKESGPAS
jgi:hypothetical protein